MSTGLIDQLETYFTELDRAQGSVSADRVAEQLDNVRELPVRVVRTWTKPNLWVAAAAAAVVLLLVGLLPFLLTVGNDETEPATTVSTLTPTTSATPTTVAEIETSPRVNVAELPDGASAGWRWVSTGLAGYLTGGNENIDGFIVGRFDDGTFFAWNPGWLQGGLYDGSLGDDPVETLMLSTDGVTWSPVDLPFTEDALSLGISTPKFAIRTFDPGPFDASTYEGESHYWTTNNGIDWFEIPYLPGPWHQIGDTIVVNQPNGITVSDDRGAAFEVIQGDQFGDFRDRVLFVFGDTFRMLHLNHDVSLVPTLWSSNDGRVWSELGPVPDLSEPGAIRDWRTAVLDDGRILLTAEPDRNEFDVNWSWWMVSDDGGRMWRELETAPTRRWTTDESAPLTQRLGHVDGWTVASIEESDGFNYLLATRSGNSWLRLEPPTIGGRGFLGVNPGGVVVAGVRNGEGTVMLWIALPPDE